MYYKFKYKDKDCKIMRLNHEIYNEIPRTVKNWSEGDVLKWFAINGIDYTRPVNAPA